MLLTTKWGKFLVTVLTLTAMIINSVKSSTASTSATTATTTSTSTLSTWPETTSSTTLPQNWVNYFAWEGICKTGTSQSPIDMPNNLTFTYMIANIIKITSSNYSEKSYVITAQNNQLFGIDISGNGYIMVEKNGINYKYDGVAMELHYTSEHSINGVYADMEIHIVHVKNSDYLKSNGVTNDPDKKNNRLVVAIRVHANGDFNSEFEKLNLKTIGPTTADFNLNNYIPIAKSIYHYEGSITTPECSEDVNWVIQEQHIMVSPQQYSYLSTWIFGLTKQKNYRPIQPLNNRKIYYQSNALFPAINQPDTSPEAVEPLSINTWDELRPWFNSCQTGQRQSPIDIPYDKDFKYNLNPVITIMTSNYNKASFELNHWNETLFGLNITGNGYIMVKKDEIMYKYDGVGFYLHYDSMHTIGGAKADLEIHIVHEKNLEYLSSNGITKDPDMENKKLIVAIRVNANGIANPDFDKLNIKNIGPTSSDFDINRFIPLETPIYHYLGSLTNPSCSEDVNWIIQEKIIQISAEQYDSAKSWIFMFTKLKNTRSVKLLNSRSIYYQLNKVSGAQTTSQPITKPIYSTYKNVNNVGELPKIPANPNYPEISRQDLVLAVKHLNLVNNTIYTNFTKFQQTCSQNILSIHPSQCTKIKMDGYWCCQVNYRNRKTQSYCASFTDSYAKALVSERDKVYNYVCSIRYLEVVYLLYFIIAIGLI